MDRPAFHLAFPVDDLDRARAFYGEVLGCSLGRSSDRWQDFDLYGHQIVAHLTENLMGAVTNEVDGNDVPAFHFGLVLSMEDWSQLAERLRDRGVQFLIEPRTRFAGAPGEQSTFFVTDPAGNALEFKAFADESQLFATD